MANMSYCRFQNTLSDLLDCKTALDDYVNGADPDAISSREERFKAKRLIEVCREISDSFEESDIDRIAEENEEHEGE